MANQINMEIEQNALVNSFDDVEPLLENINWNFSQSLFLPVNDYYPFDTRKHLPYPGTYVPELPYTLIELLTKKGAKILDPFLGSGTTFLQALLLERIPFGSDTCIVSTEFVSTLSTIFFSAINKEAYNQKLKKILIKYDSTINYYDELVLSHKFIHKMKPWYESITFNKLCYLIIEKNITTDNTLAKLMHIAFFSATKNSCSQDRGWGCIADNMIPKNDQLKEKNIFKNVSQKISQLLEDIQISKTSFLENSNIEGTNQLGLNVNYGDIRNFDYLKENSIDSIITSPPYPNMTDYITSQRLNYYYLEVDPDIEKFNESGARFKRMRSKSNFDYKEDMLAINKRLYQILKPKGYLCLILPEFDEIHERDNIRKAIITSIIDNLSDIGFHKKVIYERIIPSMRRSHNQKWASLKKEKIYIYQK